MAVPHGLSFADTDTGYALHRREGDEVTSIHLSESEMLGLQQTLADWKNRALLLQQGQSGQVEATATYFVHRLIVETDSLKSSVLLRWSTEIEQEPRASLSLSPATAEFAITEIRMVLEELSAANEQRQ